MKKGLLIIGILLTSFLSSFAAHIPGGNLSWTCTGNPNEYIVTIKIFVSCPSSFWTSTLDVKVANTCGLKNPKVTLDLVSITDVSQICDADTSRSDCVTGQRNGIAGVKMYVFSKVVTLPGPCNSWDFSYGQCCRDNSTNTTGTSRNEIYFNSRMYSATAPCDGSPVVTAQPIPYVCAGVQTTYCPGAVDPDGDSLVYTLVDPKGFRGTPFAYRVPYTTAAPLTGLVMDSITGCITFTQPTTGNFVVVYLIEAYDAAGNMTGYITHDFQFEVMPNNGDCRGPAAPLAGVTNPTGTVIVTGSSTVEICEGESFCIDIEFSDPDLADTLRIDTASSSIFAAMPGVRITQVGNNPAVYTICWDVPAGASSNTQGNLSVTDGSCPIENLASFPLVINVINATVANAPITICGPQTAQLTVAGGTIFTWYNLATPGVPIPVGPDFSCNPCANPIASPAAMGVTSYYVISDLAVGCTNTDTTTVTRVPDFTPTTFGDSSLCDFYTVPIGAATPPGGYTALWSPAVTLSNAAILTPNASPLATTTYQVVVTSPLGCVKKDSVLITVNSKPNGTIVPGDTAVCPGQPIQFDIIPIPFDDFNTSTAANWCNLKGATRNTDCGSVTGDALHFSGPTSTTREAVTKALDVTSCTTLDFSLFIANDGSGVAPCENADRNEDVELSYSTVGCNGPWILIQVYDESDWDAAGPYNNAWTAFSVPIPAGAATVATHFKWAQLKFGSRIDNWALDDVDLSCGATYNVIWSPGTELNNSTIINPISTPTVTTAYTVTLTDSVTLCTNTLTRTVTVLPDFTISTTPNDTSVCVGEPANFTVTPNIPSTSYIYTWHAAGVMNDSTLANPIGTFTRPGVYTIRVDVSLPGCKIHSDTMVVTVIEPLMPTVNLTHITCKGDTDGKIIISPNFGLGSEVQSFVWSDSLTGAILQNTANLSTGMQDSLINLTAGTYMITMTDSTGCSIDTSVTIIEPDSVTINVITADDILCIGGSIQIDANAIGGTGNTYTYTWVDLSTGAVIPGNGPHTISPIVSPTCYTVVATDVNGCFSVPAQTCMSLYPNILVSTPNGSKFDTITICPASADGGPFNTNLEMSAIGGMGVPYTYTWYDNGAPIGTGNILNVTPPSTPYTYIGVATDNCTTPGDTVWVTIEWADVISPSFVKDRADSCYSVTPINFTNTSVPTAMISATEWIFSDGTVLNGSPATGVFNSPGCRDLSMKVTTTDGCDFTIDSVNYVCPHDYPVVNFYMTPPIANILNTEIDFTNLSTGNNLSYLWMFNSGLTPDTSVVTHPTFVYKDMPGTYDITLTATSNPEGCVSTRSGTVIINGIYLFYAPNTFSPNGDGVNDIFIPYGEGIDFSQYRMHIFDRWGELLYESNDASLGWNGTYKGETVQTGTYVWKIIAKEQYSTIIHNNYGNVNIIK